MSSLILFNTGMTLFQLDDLGTLCGLMPDMTPSEKELQIVCMLLSGVGKTQGDGKLNLSTLFLKPIVLYIPL